MIITVIFLQKIIHRDLCQSWIAQPLEHMVHILCGVWWKWSHAPFEAAEQTSRGSNFQISFLFKCLHLPLYPFLPRPSVPSLSSLISACSSNHLFGFPQYLIFFSLLKRASLTTYCILDWIGLFTGLYSSLVDVCPELGVAELAQFTLQVMFYKTKNPFMSLFEATATTLHHWAAAARPKWNISTLCFDRVGDKLTTRQIILPNPCCWLPALISPRFVDMKLWMFESTFLWTLYCTAVLSEMLRHALSLQWDLNEKTSYFQSYSTVLQPKETYDMQYCSAAWLNQCVNKVHSISQWYAEPHSA